MEETRMVVLETAQREDMREFIEKLQEAFAVAVVENFEPMEDGRQYTIFYMKESGWEGWWYPFIRIQTIIRWSSFSSHQSITAADWGWQRGGQWRNGIRTPLSGKRLLLILRSETSIFM